MDNVGLSYWIVGSVVGALLLTAFILAPALVKANINQTQPQNITIQISDVETIIRRVLSEQYSTIQPVQPIHHHHTCCCPQCSHERVVEQYRPITPELECSCRDDCHPRPPVHIQHVPAVNVPVPTTQFTPPASVVAPSVQIVPGPTIPVVPPAPKPDKTPVQRPKTIICPSPQLNPLQSR